MKGKLQTAWVLALSLAATAASAAVTVEDAWVRATAPGQAVAAAYLKLRSSEPAALVGIQSAASKEAEIHETSMQGGVMRMRAVPRIELPRDRTVALQPGGHHIMLMQLAKPLKPGDKVPLTIMIERADKSRERVQIEAEVRTTGGKSASHGQHH